MGDPFSALREALKVSPDNVPLRRHMGESLLKAGLLEEAEQELRIVVQRAPDDEGAALMLATVFLRRAKAAQAIVIVEDWARRGGASSAMLVLYARLLLHDGQHTAAVHQYKQAMMMGGAQRDQTLEKDLGLLPAAAGGGSGPDLDHNDEGDDEDGGRIRQRADDGPRMISPDDLERPKTTFADVGGMDHVKQQVNLKIIQPLRQPELYKAYGKKVGGGVLMYGPPGCGKTHLARATAGEVQAHFLAVGIHDVLSMWMGQSEQQLHALFEQAREHAPCVLFFDEVDALGASRSDMRTSAGRQLINQFLSELDGMEQKNDGVLVLAATNAPWHLDPAFRRPGRFDRIIFVPPPDGAARAAILDIHLRGKPTKDVDLEAVAKKTEGFSGADLRGVVDRAVEEKLEEALAKGFPSPVTTKDLLAAAKSARATTTEWFSAARNHALYANQGGLYDDILSHLKMK